MLSWSSHALQPIQECFEIIWNVFNYKYQMAESNGLQNKDKNVLIKMFWDCK